MVEDVNKNRHPITEVIWEDAWIEAKAFPIKDIAELSPVIRSTIGYAIASTEECIILATDLYDKDETIFNTPMIIPWNAVIHCWEFDIH